MVNINIIMWKQIKNAIVGGFNMKNAKKVGNGALTFTFILGGCQSLQYAYQQYKEFIETQNIEKMPLDQSEIDYYKTKAKNIDVDIEEFDMKKMKYKEMEIMRNRAIDNKRAQIDNIYFSGKKKD